MTDQDFEEWRKMSEEHIEGLKDNISILNNQLGVAETSLKGLTTSYDLAVEEIKRLSHSIPEWKMIADERIVKDSKLIRDMTYTLRSGISATDTIQELTQRAKDLGCYP